MDPAFEGGAWDRAFELVTERVEVGDELAVEDADFGVLQTSQKLSELDGELGAALRELTPGDEVGLVEQLREIALPVGHDQGRDIGFARQRAHRRSCCGSGTESAGAALA